MKRKEAFTEEEQRRLYARAWYLKNVEPTSELDKKVQATLDYVKRLQPDDEEYTIWAYELVNSRHGQFAPRLFISMILNGMESEVLGKFDEVTDSNVLEKFDLVEEVYDLAEELGNYVAACFNHYSKMPGVYHFGTHEADGSLGVYYTENV